MVTAGFAEDDVRAASKAMGLRTWTSLRRPAWQRNPYGTQVLSSESSGGSGVRAEAALHRLGFAQVRVRHYGDTARIELDLDDLPRVFEERAAVVAAVRGVGYRYVTIDLEGFRSGNLNG